MKDHIDVFCSLDYHLRLLLLLVLKASMQISIVNIETGDIIETIKRSSEIKAPPDGITIVQYFHSRSNPDRFVMKINSLKSDCSGSTDVGAEFGNKDKFDVDEFALNAVPYCRSEKKSTILVWNCLHYVFEFLIKKLIKLEMIVSKMNFNVKFKRLKNVTANR